MDSLRPLLQVKNVPAMVTDMDAEAAGEISNTKADEDSQVTCQLGTYLEHKVSSNRSGVQNRATVSVAKTDISAWREDGPSVQCAHQKFIRIYYLRI